MPGQDRHSEGAAGTAVGRQKGRSAGAPESPGEAGIPDLRLADDASADVRIRRADWRVDGARRGREVDSQRPRADERGAGEGVAERARPAAVALEELPRNVEAALNGAREHPAQG